MIRFVIWLAFVLDSMITLPWFEPDWSHCIVTVIKLSQRCYLSTGITLTGVGKLLIVSVFSIDSQSPAIIAVIVIGGTVLCLLVIVAVYRYTHICRPR